MPVTLMTSARKPRPRPLPKMPMLPDIPTDGSAHVIPLGRGRYASMGLYAVIDLADVPLIDGWKFYACRNQSGHWDVHAWRGSRADGTYEHSLLHAILTGYAQTDHRDGNPFNNCRANLRECTSAQNQANRTLQASNTSGYVGLHWVKSSRKWRAQIAVNGVNQHLGLFDDKVDAALAYDMAAREYHKSYACLNFPIAGERSAITGEIRPMITT